MNKDAEGRRKVERSESNWKCGINWEWIIRCAKDSKCNVVIVSRDSDYGQLLGKQRVLNTWLRQEFYSRTSKRHQILLTDRLTDALEQANITVSSEEQQQESEFLEQWIPLPIVDIAQATKGMAGMAQFLEGIKLQQEQLLQTVKGIADFPIYDILGSQRQDDQDD